MIQDPNTLNQDKWQQKGVTEKTLQILRSVSKELKISQFGVN